MQRLRAGFAADPRFADLEFAFDAGGMIRAAMNEGKSTPINIRVTGKDLRQGPRDRRGGTPEDRRDRRRGRRPDHPAARLSGIRHRRRPGQGGRPGLTQADVMKNVVAALNSSIQFNKKNFWIDPVSKNQYFVGVQYLEEDINSIETLLDIPITSPKQDQPIPLRNIVTLRRGTVPTEVTHNNLQPTIDLTMGVQGRDLGHVADDVARSSTSSAKPSPTGRGSLTTRPTPARGASR